MDYDISSRKFSTNTKWFNDRVGIEVDADSEDLITQVQGHIKQTFTQNDRDVNAKLSSVYDALTQKVTATFGLASGDVAAQVDFDNDTKESVIGVAYKVKEFTAHPSINVKSGEVKYGISRALSSGDIDAVLTPNDNVEVEWTDKAKNGAWKTKLNYPLNGGATKISFARDFDC